MKRPLLAAMGIIVAILVIAGAILLTVAFLSKDPSAIQNSGTIQLDYPRDWSCNVSDTAPEISFPMLGNFSNSFGAGSYLQNISIYESFANEGLENGNISFSLLYYGVNLDQNGSIQVSVLTNNATFITSFGSYLAQYCDWVGPR